MPANLTSEGAHLSPALAWEDLPRATRSLALMMEDIDASAPGSRSLPFTHWLVYNLQPSSTGINLGANRSGLPAGAVEGKNDLGQRGYAGPDRPRHQHRYRFRLLALDVTLDATRDEALDRQGLLRAVQAHVLDEAELMGWYRAADVGTNPMPVT